MGMALWPFGGKESGEPLDPREAPVVRFGLMNVAREEDGSPVRVIRFLLEQLPVLADLKLALFLPEDSCPWSERDPFEDADPLTPGQQRDLLQFCRTCRDEELFTMSAKEMQDRFPGLESLLSSRSILHVRVQPLPGDAPYAGWLLVGDAGTKLPELGPLLAGSAQELAAALSVADLKESWKAERRKVLGLQEELAAIKAERTWDEKRRERELEQAEWKIQEAERIKNEFLSSVSHELRTPLNAIQGYTRIVLRDENLSDRQRLSLDRVLSSSNNQLKLINNILEYSRLEAGRMRLELEHVELRPMLAECQSQLESLAQERGLSLDLEMDPDLPQHTVTDHPKLERVLINLLGNAIKFTHEGSVTLVAGVKAGLLRFMVRDTGIGIPSDELDMIFDRFTRASQTDSDAHTYTGTGLGLAISRRITELLGGRISVESTRGEGSTFCVELPHILDLETARQALDVEEST